MRILVAPQEFKGSLSAEEAASAIGDGIRDAQPGWTVDYLPMSDGGPGFIDAMRRALKTDIVAVAVSDPLGRPVVGRYLDVRGSCDVIIEAAQANGLMHCPSGARHPLVADTFGVGELIAAAARHAPARMVIGVGGSATTDGGAGMARALGARLLDAAGQELPPGGAALAALERVEWSPPEWLGSFPIVVATDVQNPLLGPDGAAYVYGPQKGATPRDVETLDAALANYSRVLHKQLDVDVADLPGAGAAGGLAAGLIAFLGATVASGFDLVSDATGLLSRLEEADIIVTGEGRFDSQSVQGKTTGRLLELAANHGKPAMVFAGATQNPAQNVRTLVSREPNPALAVKNAAPLLRALAREWAESGAPEPT